MPALAPADALRGMGEPARILVITLRRLGDVLLTTPLIRTLRRGYPRARIDVLAFRGGDGILVGNPDVDDVITMREKPTVRETAALIGRLWRRYDLVVSTQSGDRPTFYALIAGRYRVGLVPPAGMTGARWKRRAYHVAIAPEPDTHRIAHFQQLTDALGLPFMPDLVCPQGAAAGPVPRPPYAVLHANPAYRYKRWTDAGWRGLARALAAECGLTVVVTGGPDAAERAYLDELWAPVEPAVVRLDGRLDWPQLAALLSGAAVYVGVDTSMSHLAAATGCPTIALYGPTSPRLIGPWPVGGLNQPWEPSGTVQRRGNVQVVQNPLPCLPCEKLGCARHLDSYAQCLDELSVGQVLTAVDRALGRRSEAAIQLSGLTAPGSSNGP
jgi:lipopolysaccharide heptosyltransferase III